MQAQKSATMLKQQKKIPNESICLDCVNYAKKLHLTSDRSFTFIKGRQTFYDKPTNSKDNTFSMLDKEIPVFDIESLNSIIDTDIEELVAGVCIQIRNFFTNNL